MLDLIRLGLWTALWMLGGLWLARAAFRLKGGELLVAGIGVGLATENFLANLLGRFLPLPASFWVAAGCTAVLGVIFALREGPRGLLHLPQSWGTLLALAAISLLSFGLGRGLGVFDEYAQLPTISMLAVGMIPPRFPLDPGISYDYHYFMLFFAAQVVRIGDLHLWTALDLVRGLATGLAAVAMFHWARRLTFSKLGGVLGSAFVLFASGARWLLLLLPDGVLKPLAAGITLIGSGASSGADLSTAIAGPWVIEGAGPISFPFAFVNGVFQPGVLAQFVANGLTEIAFVVILLLTFNYWRSPWRGALVSALLLSAMMLLTEAGVVLELGGWGLVVLITAVRRRSLKLPSSLWGWLAAAATGHLLGAWQGGALVGLLPIILGLSPEASYQTYGFQLVFPPTLVSSHLGVLSLAQPGQFLAAVFELGPLLLVFPLLVAWGWKGLRVGRWYEAALVGEALLSLAMLFVNYTGSEGVRITARLYRFMFVLVIFAAPLGWNWAARRVGALRWLAAAAAGVCLLGGLMLFGVELPVLKHPVYTYFISEMDVRMSDRFWNRLEKDALVFDAEPYRAPTVLGRFTDSSTTWFDLKPEWKALFKQPYPDRLRAAGYSYAYLDNYYFRDLPAPIRQAWESGCAQKVGEASYEGLWRRLYDLKGCGR